jgi:hypothetical protein
MRGRGVFVCISPWNFPLAIFTGQVAAALAAGNAVVAKPAEQTPLVAFETIRLLHRAGIPAGALNLVPGDGKTGALLVADRRVAGVAFTGSTEVARSINRTLAAKDGPIVPLIAETGGVNAMIVDATALPEQITDDVIASAFRSAGQRCSALRLLCVQEDVADRVLDMVVGAARELSLGDPRDLATHVGPVIDSEAKSKLDRWIAMMNSRGAVLCHLEANPPAGGTYVAPTIIELDTRANSGRSIRTGSSSRALAVKRTRLAARRYCRQQHRVDPRHPLSHRDGRHARCCAHAAWQRLCESKHDRGGGRHPALRRDSIVRDRAESRGPELFAAVCSRTGRHGEHGGVRGQRHAAFGRRVVAAKARNRPCSGCKRHCLGQIRPLIVQLL